MLIFEVVIVYLEYLEIRTGFVSNVASYIADVFIVYVVTMFI